MHATALALLALSACAAGQSLPDSKVPFIGGGVYKADDPKLANYTFQFKPPFANANYGGYYSWQVNNNTVAITNFTGYTAPPDSLTKYPFFLISEGKPKAINPNPSDKARRDDEHGQKFQKILHIIFENEYYGWTMSDPWWQLLARRGKLLTNSHGITHPSLPNYAAMVAGDFFGIANEDFYHINATTVYDLLDAKGLDYATYVEWYNPAETQRGPNDCNNYVTYGPMDNTNPEWVSQIYRRLDTPAMLFTTYTTDYRRCSKIYNATDKFDADVRSHSLPAYSFYVPDMLHNGHDPESDSDYVHQSTTSGMWLNAFLDMYLPALQEQGTLVVATWDEATWTNDSDSIPNNNNSIATVLFGHGITPNTKDDTYITHYGLLRGVIHNFGLGSLGRNDTNATNGDLYALVN
ncbi:hypothetical protein VTN96DRAFT_8054 [Rasamsonia emersonii]|uniref:Acid phosphatase n=1 Tax=Rasamsonia emersonii (strain ATCC 16479 / CBS 393.64 / IMI 116815) TaxID=1408163 RepID=A0A0F4YYR8_RASE3|nr:hypothetical protein T310_2977 [Rasamsonia emersonii CBS 393.64]KKA22986.1 hypothetical protein T310_2977 [Rasamsonia emersonii CBS 393.64]